jgi:hypothetical protein
VDENSEIIPLKRNQELSIEGSKKDVLRASQELARPHPSQDQEYKTF